jgi:ferredoxin like protein
MSPPGPRPSRRGAAVPTRVADYPEISFETRMSTVEFRVHERAHITLDDSHCRDCSARGCITACPADLFVPTSDGGIVFNYEQCFECGTCYLVCNEEGAITWTYPEGGHGVVFHRS